MKVKNHMKIKNCTQDNLLKALDIVNKKYNDNIKFKYIEQLSDKLFKLRLSICDSHSTGTKIGYRGRRVTAACWHVHGNFFDALLKENPQITITVGGLPTIKVKDGKVINNWIDYGGGCGLYPSYASEECNCESNKE